MTKKLLIMLGVMPTLSLAMFLPATTRLASAGIPRVLSVMHDAQQSYAILKRFNGTKINEEAKDLQNDHIASIMAFAKIEQQKAKEEGERLQEAIARERCNLTELVNEKKYSKYSVWAGALFAGLVIMPESNISEIGLCMFLCNTLVSWHFDPSIKKSQDAIASLRERSCMKDARIDSFSQIVKFDDELHKK